MKTNIGQEVQDTSSSFATIIGRYINRRYFQILRAINWESIRDDYSFDTIAGTQDYVLPDDFGKEVYVYDSTNKREIRPISRQNLVRYYSGSGLDTTGTSYRYLIWEDTVKTQPSSASQLTIISSSASDTTQNILIRGIDSNGMEITERKQLNGTTNVTTTNSFSRIKGISKDAETTGYVTVSAGSDTIAKLAPTVLEARYKKIKLHFVPTSTITIKMPYYIKPMPLSENEDYPVIDIADLIERGATADAWRYKRQFAKAQAEEALFSKELAEYIWERENKSNEPMVLNPATFNRDDLI